MGTEREIWERKERKVKAKTFFLLFRLSGEIMYEYIEYTWKGNLGGEDKRFNLGCIAFEATVKHRS